MYAIETLRLSKRYPEVTAVEGLDLQIPPGELFSLLGVNGAGKTTTIKMLTGLVSPTGGDAAVLGHSILTDLPAVKKIIAVAPQQTAVAPGLTVQENLQLLCGIHGLSRQAARERTEQLSARLGLSSVLHRRAGKLSGGWQRRLSIAMALISEPQVLFLDEPTLGLDVLARAELWDIIRSLKGRVTIVLTTHYMEEAEALSDRIGILKAGRLLAVGTAAQLKAQAGEDSFQQAFIRLVKEDGV